MIEPVSISVGISAAFRAYELLKKGLDTGREIEDMSGQVKNFFKAKHQVEAVVKRAEENDQLDSLYAAIDVVTELERLEKLQEKIKWRYISAGKSATWTRIVREQSRIEKKRAADAKKKINKANSDAALIKDIALIFIFLILGLGVAAAILYFILSLGEPEL